MPKLMSNWDLGILTIYGEARGEKFEGKVAVGEVIRNRMRDRYSSDGTVEDTVLRPYQFSVWNTGGPRVLAELDYESDMYDECAAAWAASEYSNLTKGANLYYNPRLANPKWAQTTEHIVTIGNHKFHKD